MPYIFAQRLELLRVDVLPYPLHIIPVGDDAVFQRVSDLEQTAQLLRLLTYEDVAFQGAGQHSEMLRSADERGKVAFG